MTIKSYSRHREREPVAPTDIYCTRQYWGNKGTGTATYGPYYGFAENETMDDVVTENYRKIIDSGGIINNRCSYVKEWRKTTGTGLRSFSNVGGGVDWTGAVSQMLDAQGQVSPIWPRLEVYDNEFDDLLSSAKLAALANIDSTPYAFGEDVLELRETIRFLRSPLSSLKKLFFTKGDPRLSFKDIDRWSDVWLQYRFAAAPLVRSIADGLEAISYTPKTLTPRLTARGIRDREIKREKLDEPTHTAQTTGDWFNLWREKSVEYHASILYEVSNPIKQDLKWRLGFRVKDIPYTIWQVMPYSFMVDRVYDVSSAIRAVTNLADPKIKILAASWRRKYNSVYRYQFHRSNSSSYTTDGPFIGDIVESGHFDYTRYPWSPSIRDTVPKAKWNGLIEDATKTLDLATLLWKYFR